MQLNETLKKISQLAIKLNEPYNNITESQKNSEWLGEAPASRAEIEVVEKKLNVQLPDDYKTFLLLCNGFTSPIGTEPTFQKLSDIDYLKTLDPNLMETGLDDIAKELSRSILVAGINEEQYFLLIPSTSEDDKWKYWKFANWIPGEEPYENLQAYFEKVLEFMQEETRRGKL